MMAKQQGSTKQLESIRYIPLYSYSHESADCQTAVVVVPVVVVAVVALVMLYVLSKYENSARCRRLLPLPACSIDVDFLDSVGDFS